MDGTHNDINDKVQDTHRSPEIKLEESAICNNGCNIKGNV